MDQHMLFDRFFSTIKTERLSLRPLQAEDETDMFEYTQNPVSSSYLKWTAHTNITQTREFIRQILANYQSKENFLWGISLQETGKLIGAVHLFDVHIGDGNAELSYIINPAFQGKGYASEAVRAVIRYALDTMNLIRVQARCDVENIASEQVMIKSGMQYEGTLRKSFFIKGRYRDFKLYSIVREVF